REHVGVVVKAMCVLTESGPRLVSGAQFTLDVRDRNDWTVFLSVAFVVLAAVGVIHLEHHVAEPLPQLRAGRGGIVKNPCDWPGHIAWLRPIPVSKAG